MALYLPRNPLVFASGVAVPLTGSTSETTLATITIPGGAMGLNGVVELVTYWTHTNNANAKTLHVRFGGTGGTLFLNAAVASQASTRSLTLFSNRNSASSQVGFAAANTIGLGNAGGAAVTATVDTSADQQLLVRATLANGADTVQLESYFCKVWRP